MKRIITLIAFAIICIIGSFQQTFDENYLSIMIVPIRWIGDALRFMSLQGVFLNILAMVIYSIIGVSPLVYLSLKVYKKTVRKPDYVLLPLISITVLIVVYYFINPHIIVSQLGTDFVQQLDVATVQAFEELLLIGLGFVLNSVILIYIVTALYVNKQFDSIKLFRILLDILIVVSMFDVLYASLGTMIQSYESATSIARTTLWIELLGKLVVVGLFIYVIETFKIFIVKVTENGFQQELLILLQRLYVVSFILLISSLVAQLLLNLYQFVNLDNLTNIVFQFDVPLVIIVFVSIIFIVSKYFEKVIALKQDNEMII